VGRGSRITQAPPSARSMFLGLRVWEANQPAEPPTPEDVTTQCADEDHGSLSCWQRCIPTPRQMQVVARDGLLGHRGLCTHYPVFQEPRPTKLAAYPALFPFNASPSHPPNIPKPPRGVIAPIQRIFVNARTYKEPLKRTKPPNMSQNASRGKGSHREITNRTTACTRLYSTPVCQIDNVPSASNRERNAWAPKAPKATAKKPLKAATVLDK